MDNIHCILFLFYITTNASLLATDAIKYTQNITIPRACLPPHDTYPFCDIKLSLYI